MVGPTVPFRVTGSDPVDVCVAHLSDLGSAVRLDGTISAADWPAAELSGAFLLDVVSEGLTDDDVDVSVTLVLRPAFAGGRDSIEVAAALFGDGPGDLTLAEAWLLLEATQELAVPGSEDGATIAVGFRTPWLDLLDD